MKSAQERHFWTWFQRHSLKLQLLSRMDKKEREYWFREIDAHLLACTKKLFFELIQCHQKGLNRLIITAYGNTKYFRRAEAFVAKAPKIPGWEVIALLPPGMLGEGLLSVYSNAGINLTNLWFMPSKEKLGNGKTALVVYAEFLGEVTSEMKIAVGALIYDLLGEKTAGLEIDNIRICNILELPRHELQHLVPIRCLTAYITCRDTSPLFINAKGAMEVRK